MTGADRVAKITPLEYQQPKNIAGSTPSTLNDQLFTSFYLYDHLGNTRLVYTPEVQCPTFVMYEVDFAADYYPYGKSLREFVGGDGAEKFLTTQHERDQETGLDYRGARFYDGDVGRFLSLDPLAADYPSLSDYSYVAGNPVMFIDPTGMAVETKYKDWDTGELIEDVNDGSDQEIYVDREEFNWAKGRADILGADLSKREDGEKFTFAYKNLINNDVSLLWSGLSAMDYAMKNANDPCMQDPAGGCYVHVELTILEYAAAGKFFSAAFQGIKYIWAGAAATETGIVVSGAVTYTVHGAGQMTVRKITEKMIVKTIEKGAKYWDPKNSTFVYILEGAYASGKNILVATNPLNGAIVTTIRGGRKIIKSRFIPID